MPIYEYECQKCGETFELLQSISDSPLKKCKYCNGKVEKLISLSTFQLKGTGWYATDYANKNNNNNSRSKEKGSTTEKKKEEKSPKVPHPANTPGP